MEAEVNSEMAYRICRRSFKHSSKLSFSGLHFEMESFSSDRFDSWSVSLTSIITRENDDFLLIINRTQTKLSFALITNERLVSKETVVSSWWRSEALKCGMKLATMHLHTLSMCSVSLKRFTNIPHTRHSVFYKTREFNNGGKKPSA